ncbi:hypothetical protein HanRHA438_Chr08g0353041 [Helianthus annuus]|nr:hypothetical protein HanHA89_Chr08g0299551 [Helianthus annuus]KAJ0719383.1 hypothetical protein HanLR1_Chr08g0281111 [Helianthus annuus]KAJ0898102.1 hypothetical protein HanRHA438_Chr08g0353041 [Helianthus annuus]
MIGDLVESFHPDNNSMSFLWAEHTILIGVKGLQHLQVDHKE